MTALTKCRLCDGPVVQPAGRGRPRIFCGKACQARLGEFVRRTGRPWWEMKIKLQSRRCLYCKDPLDFAKLITAMYCSRECRSWDRPRRSRESA